MKQAMQGMKVIDLTRVVSGPYCTYQLALMGADCIKIEEPGKGDAGKAGKAPAGPKTAAELEQDFRKRRAEAEKSEQEQQKKAAEAKDSEENCRAARAQLVSLEAGQRQTRTGPNGERYFLDESQVENEKQRARRAIEVSCK